jgi:hypothetical protein
MPEIFRNEIPGVPVGTRIAAVSRVDAGSWYIDIDGALRRWEAKTSQETFTVIVPDNQYCLIDLSAVPIPDGWERDGKHWFRAVAVGDWYIPPCSGDPSQYRGEVFGMGEDPRRIIVHRIAPKTKRVLVAEWEIGEMNEGDAIRALNVRGAVCRIEERPL